MRNASARPAPGDAPWYVVPADDKENARLIVSRIMLDTLEGLENDLSNNKRRASAGVAGDPQTARQVSDRGAGARAKLLPASEPRDQGVRQIEAYAKRNSLMTRGPARSRPPRPCRPEVIRDLRISGHERCLYLGHGSIAGAIRDWFSSGASGRRLPSTGAPPSGRMPAGGSATSEPTNIPPTPWFIRSRLQSNRS